MKFEDKFSSIIKPRYLFKLTLSILTLWVVKSFGRSFGSPLPFEKNVVTVKHPKQTTGNEKFLQLKGMINK
jgi:hypothetical protein